MERVKKWTRLELANGICALIASFIEDRQAIAAVYHLAGALAEAPRTRLAFRIEKMIHEMAPSDGGAARLIEELWPWAVGVQRLVDADWRIHRPKFTGQQQPGKLLFLVGPSKEGDA